jgi:hypothetical protein
VLFYETRLTNATVVDDAIRFVSSKTKENLKSSSSNSNNEPDYDEDQIEEEQEEEAGEITSMTNQVF